MRDPDLQLSTQRLRELMLWHGTDEGNLPPAATLVNLSRDTIAALAQLQDTRAELLELRATLAQLFWSCESSPLRLALLKALGAPPATTTAIEELPGVSWEASPNGLPLPALASDSAVSPAQRQWATG